MIDLERLIMLRAVVARFGEMDIAKWWNTKGQLGKLGAAALRRGFPRTCNFAQARSVFAVAAYRCAEVFDPPDSVTLWRLPEEIEEEFDARWEHWLDNAAAWSPFFDKLHALESSDLMFNFRSLQLAEERDVEANAKLRRSADGRAVTFSGVFSASDGDISQLAFGFARGEVGSLAVPYMRTGPA